MEVARTDSKCPPRPDFGRYDSICAVDGIDNTSNICADNPCTGSSDCFALSDTEFHCVCHPGYKKNKNGQCEKIVEVNECEMKNECFMNADCFDTVHSQGSKDHPTRLADPISDSDIDDFMAMTFLICWRVFHEIC